MSKAVAKALPIPEFCDCCASVNVIYTDNSAIYGRTFGEWPRIYFCTDCRAAVGCHPKTNLPLGKMADRATRELRAKAHAAFDPFWKSRVMSRSEAYAWLAKQLGINDPEECHISWLSSDQLKTMIPICRDYFAKNFNALAKRKEKRDARNIERNKRDAARERRYRAERKS